MKMNGYRWPLLALAAMQLPMAAAMAPLPAEELVRRIEEGRSPVVLDVRTPEEYAQGHVPGAILVPHDAVAEHRALLEPLLGKELVIYCRSGRRTVLASAALRALGASNVREMDGNWLGWSERGLPVEGRP